MAQPEKQVQRVHLEVLDQRDQLVQQAVQVQLVEEAPRGLQELVA
jgi:hypothetical protein